MWGVVDSINLPPEQALANGGANPLSAPTYIQAREYSQSNITLAGNVSSSEAIATIGGFRCTSPSVCVGFSNIYAADGCGVLSTDGELISYTIIPFAPGELSTIEIPAWVRASVPPKAAIRSFDFADLPCPPQSVMYAVEYKPAPGEPYRPVISAPSRLSSLLPEWPNSGCIISAALFNGVDPLRALKPAEILTPRVTQALPSTSVAVVAAPASGIRANEPSKTLNPSSRGGKEASVPSDPDTSESGSVLSDPSSSDPQPADSENTDPNASGSEDSAIAESTPNNAPPQDIRPGVHDPISAATDSGDSDIEEPTSNNAGPQDTGPSLHDPENTVIDSSTTNPKPLVPGNSDPKYANSPSSSSQDTDPQALNAHNKPEEVDGSSLKLSKSDGTNASSSSPDPSHPNVPDNPSDMADPSNGSSKDPPSDDYKPHSSDSDGDNIPNSEAQEAGAADPDSHNVDSVLGESKYSNSQGQDTAIAHPNKSPAAKPKATNGDTSDVKGPDAELNLFDVLPTKLFDINKLTSPNAKPGVKQHATPNDPERISSSQPGNSEVPQSENDLNEIEALFDKTFSPQESAKVLSTAHSGAVIDLPSKIAPAHDSTASPQNSANDTPIADSDKVSKSPSKTAPTGDLASATGAVGISEKTGVASSSATTASIAALDFIWAAGG